MGDCPTDLLVSFSPVVEPVVEPSATPNQTCANSGTNPVEDQFEVMDVDIENQRQTGYMDDKLSDMISPKISPKDDLKLIDQEEFDFDIMVSPETSGISASMNKSTASEVDDEEIFFGPVKHKEKCVAVCVAERVKEEEVLKPLSPLNPAQLVQLFKDAQSVALQLQSSSKKSSSGVKPKRPLPGDIRRAAHSALDSASSEDSPGHNRSGTYALESPSQGLEAVFIEEKSAATKPCLKSPQTKSASGKPRRSGLARQQSGLAPPGSKLMAPRSLSTSSDGRTTSNQSTSSASVTTSTLIPPSSRHRTLSNSSGSSCASNSSTTSGSKLPTGGNLTRTLSLKKPSTGSSMNKQGSAITSGLSKPSEGNSGLKRRPSLRLPQAGTTKHINAETSDSQSNSHKAPTALSKSGLSMPKFGLQKPAEVNKTAGTQNKSGIPPSRLQLIKPSAIPGKGLVPPRSRLAKPGSFGQTGPVKAAGPMKATTVQPGLAGQQASKVSPDASSQPKKPALKPSNPVATKRPSIFEDTPVKQDKNVQPKRIIPAADVMTPKKNSERGAPSTPVSATKSASKRRSCLPTPDRKSVSSVSSLGSRTSRSSSRGSVSSVSTIDSPCRSPALGVLVNLHQNSPSCLKPSKARVLHTPMQGWGKENEVKSVWSPVRRKRLDKEDEAIMCTKRTLSK